MVTLGILVKRHSTSEAGTNAKEVSFSPLLAHHAKYILIAFLPGKIARHSETS